MSEYPSWLKLALTFEGTKEIPGDKHNAQIQEFLRVASGGKILPDETNWCAASVQYPLIKSGYDVPLTLSAKEMMNLGLAKGQFIEIKTPRLGCIVIMKRKGVTESWQAHTGFWLDEKPGFVGLNEHMKLENQQEKILVYGGNQGNEFSKKWFDKSLVIAYLWPAAALTLPEIQRIAKMRGAEWTKKKIELLPGGMDVPNQIIIDIQKNRFTKIELIGFKIFSGLKVLGWILVDVMKIYPATKEAGKAIAELLNKGDKLPKDTSNPIQGEQSLIDLCISFIRQLFQKIVAWFKKRGK